MSPTAEKDRSKALGPVWPQSFQAAFCQRFCYQRQDYEMALFWRCLYRHALPFAFVLYRLNPEFFREDFDLIREVGNVTTPELFKSELNFFYGRNLRDKSWLRRTFVIRVSAKRLLAVKNKVFPHPLAELSLMH